jgi:hypothetical protein
VLAAAWSRRLLHLLFDDAMRGLLALAIAVAALIVLVALAVVTPSGSDSTSRGATDLCRVIVTLGSREGVPCRRHGVLLIELHERVLGQVLQPLYLGVWQ